MPRRVVSDVGRQLSEVAGGVRFNGSSDGSSDGADAFSQRRGPRSVIVRDIGPLGRRVARMKRRSGHVANGVPFQGGRSVGRWPRLVEVSKRGSLA